MFPIILSDINYYFGDFLLILEEVKPQSWIINRLSLFLSSELNMEYNPSEHPRTSTIFLSKSQTDGERLHVFWLTGWVERSPLRPGRWRGTLIKMKPRSGWLQSDPNESGATSQMVLTQSDQTFPPRRRLVIIVWFIMIALGDDTLLTVSSSQWVIFPPRLILWYSPCFSVNC